MSWPLSRVAAFGGTVLLLAFAVAYLVWLPVRPTGAAVTDFSAYYSAGRYWAQGGNPYGNGIWSVERTLPGVHAERNEFLPFVGPPLSLPLWALFGRLPYIVAAIAWTAVVAACAALIMIVPTRLAGRRTRGSVAGGLVLLSLVAAPLVVGISVGQAALPATAAVIVAVAGAAARRWLVMTLAIVVAAMLKPNDVLVVAGAVRNVAAFAVVATSALLSALGNVSLAGVIHGGAAYLDVVTHQSASERFFVYQLTPASIVYGLGVAPDVAAALGGAVAVVTVFAVIIAVRLTNARLIDSAAIACAAFPFVIPFVHEADLAIVLFPALLVVFRASGWTWIVGAIGTIFVCINPFAMAHGAFGVAFTAVTAAVAALQLAAFAPPAMRRTRLTPLAVIPLVVVLGMFAPHEPLAMWPSTLPQHRAVASNIAADAEWHDELTASGLNDPNGWVSVWRLVTLAGCACVGIAMAATAAATRPARLRIPIAAPVPAFLGVGIPSLESQREA